jgi:hypothetical protein
MNDIETMTAAQFDDLAKDVENVLKIVVQERSAASGAEREELTAEMRNLLKIRAAIIRVQMARDN